MHEFSNLLLGWRIDEEQRPIAWMNGGVPLPCAADALVSVRADKLAAHSLIVAQSGSGKSFFLGRLVEEILIRTKARCLILDPNADFAVADQVENSQKWQNMSFDGKQRRGWLPTEATRDLASGLWNKVSITHKKMGLSKLERRGMISQEPATLWWPLLSTAVLNSGLPPLEQTGLVHCHTLIKGLGSFFELFCQTNPTRDRRNSFIEEVRSFLADENNLSAVWFGKRYGNLTVDKVRVACKEDFFIYLDKVVKIDEIEECKNDYIELIERVGRFLDPKIIKYYKSKFEELNSSNLLSLWPGNDDHSSRLNIVDLPSLPNNRSRLLFVNEQLTREWEGAKKRLADARKLSDQSMDIRVPTFIVVDEAHNLIPNEERSDLARAVKEQFRTIAAEGRKYGLFLILVTQRKEKLDELVISECKNFAVMRLGSEMVSRSVAKMLSVAEPKRNFNELDGGRFMLFGEWAQGGHVEGYTAARRTKEGGRELRPSYWATVMDDV